MKRVKQCLSCQSDSNQLSTLLQCRLFLGLYPVRQEDVTEAATRWMCEEDKPTYQVLKQSPKWSDKEQKVIYRESLFIIHIYLTFC